MIAREFCKWMASFVMAAILVAIFIIGFENPMAWAIIAVGGLTALIRWAAFK